jgi:hypothetical protein
VLVCVCADVHCPQVHYEHMVDLTALSDTQLLQVSILQDIFITQQTNLAAQRRELTQALRKLHTSPPRTPVPTPPPPPPHQQQQQQQQGMPSGGGPALSSASTASACPTLDPRRNHPTPRDAAAAAEEPDAVVQLLNKLNTNLEEDRCV